MSDAPVEGASFVQPRVLNPPAFGLPAEHVVPGVPHAPPEPPVRELRRDAGTVLTRGHLGNRSETFNGLSKSEGPRLGLQELEGERLEDPPGRGGARRGTAA